ncbi:hypothetical protein [Nocardia carnea]|nr:hypothetical protein [Nocardia carnea]
MVVLYWIPVVLLLVTAVWWRQSRRAHLRGRPAPFTASSRKDSGEGRRP